MLLKLLFHYQGAKGDVLFESVLRSLEISDGKYFGLLFYDADLFSSWLDLTKKVASIVTACLITHKITRF